MLQSLLRYSLFGGANPFASLGRTLSDDEWQRLFDESRREAVTALLCDAVMQLPEGMRPPRKVLFHLVSYTQSVEQENRRREAALFRYASVTDESLSLPAVVVKGSALAANYPQPLHRECGDNDLLTGGHTARVAAMMEAQGIAVDRKDPRHVSFVFDSVTFECHTYLLYHNDDPVWMTEPLAVAGAPESLRSLKPSWSAFFLAKHAEHHAVFFHNPVRLRTLCDWSLLVSSPGFDRGEFCNLKRGTDVDMFAELMTCYCNRIFGLSLPFDEAVVAERGLVADDFKRIYVDCPERHKLAVVRVARRSWKYLRYRRKYRALYGESMFRRFYLKNVLVAIRQYKRKTEN